MRKALFVLLAGAFLAVGSFGSAGASTLPYIGHAKPTANMTPNENAACRGWGRFCRPGFTRVCRGGRCWCAPC